ncbi:MAG: 5'-nucleotidase C-terminal domain-containing protein [Elusimicrobiota bacterium]
MRYFFLALVLFLFSCANKNPEFKIFIYNDFARNVWSLRNYNDYCGEKGANQISLTFPLISPQEIPENEYNKGNDILSFAKDCSINIVSLTNTDLEKLPPQIISNYFKKNSSILATNIYNKHNSKSFFAKKNLISNINNKKLSLFSIIANSTDPAIAFYISDYRIENPLYEINKINSSTSYDIAIIILHSNLKGKNEEELNNYLKKFLSNLTRKPDFVLADINKKIKIGKTYFIPYGNKNSLITISQKLNFWKKITIEEIPKKKIGIKFVLLDDIIEKTDKYFNKKISFSYSDIPVKNGNSSLGNIYAYALFSFLKSDISIFDNNLLKKGIKKGDITIKDVYSTITDTSEKLVYIKVKGDKINELIRYTKNLNTSIYISKKYTDKDSEKIDLPQQKTYRILTTKKFIKENSELLNYITEFSILDINIIDGIMWYLRNHKLDIINKV